ncbi:diguanylate cyclase domain-containing protein [Alkalihalobacterium alkalinitrilicum]|uniref:diguanylate cyclase domain-containing protein n=1 Tax=Alkalihalobacterium alkalinitrilicum TaxID=427920 RepID=UPI0011154892|nr:GGDEF domain-containing protein [Alkalihalobacterium alkalinitrilicum]
MFLIIYYVISVPYQIFLLIALLIPFLFLNRQYRLFVKQNEKLEEERHKTEKEFHQLRQENEHLNELLKDFNQTFFSYNGSKSELFITKGIEVIFPYPQEDYSKNAGLLEEVVTSIEEEGPKFSEHLFTKKRMKNQYHIMDKHNRQRWIEVSTMPHLDMSNHIMKVDGMITDITDRKQLEEYLRQIAYYDELTDLPNRKLIYKHLRKALARSKRHHHNLSIMFIDLDGFKKVNDTLGHEGGDFLLKEVAIRLNSCVREEDLTGRLGGDEFIIVFEETSEEEIIVISERILSVVSEPYAIHEKEAKVSPSIGISIYPEDGEDIETLVQNADKAMYYAKEKGKGNYQFYTTELNNYQSKKIGIFEKIIGSVSKIKETYTKG